MQIKFEKQLKGYPSVIPYESTKKIVDQMEKCVCKIKIEYLQATGFFCKIPFPDKDQMLPVLITNNHAINEQILYQNNSKISLYIKNEQNIKQLNLNNRKKYTNLEYDITIIEIKQYDNINNFLELDDIINEGILNNDNGVNNEYLDSTIYLMQYAEGRLGVSFGVINNIYEDKKYKFVNNCNTKAGSSGSPILNLNNKVIGMHKESLRFTNSTGIFLNYPIKEFIKLCSIPNEELLKELNEKYNLNIKNTKIEKIDLRWKGLGNAGFEDLCKIEFTELKELILNNNNISDIKALKNAKFDKLEILDLTQNKISDINIFENVNFQKLKQLYLGYNNISDINIFQKTNFEKLETLYLNENKIDQEKNTTIISYLKSIIRDIQI